MKINRYIRKSAPHRGFTILELMVTVGILGILAAIAVPPLSATLRNNELRSQVSKFRSAVAFGRNQAATLRQVVSLCPSADGNACIGGQDWSGGYIVFVDPNEDGALTGGDCNPTTDCLLRSVEGLQGEATITGTANSLSFSQLGDLAQSNGETFTICADGNVDTARVVTFTAAGSNRVETGGAACP